VKTYLSYGGGVNSTALLLWLLDQGIEFEAVYADHGADWPETRAYVEMLRERGYAITVLETRREGLPLWDYYIKQRMIPVRFMRHCTEHFKVRPLLKYMAAPCVMYIGFSADEAHRAKYDWNDRRDRLYPLIEHNIDRRGCVEIIKAHGLPVPIKSGCFVCPFQRVGQWRELLTVHPDLYCKARRLEDVTNERLTAQGRPPIYIADRPLDEVAREGQLDLFGEREDRPCMCEL
jgi:hypothetical protein